MRGITYKIKGRGKMALLHTEHSNGLLRFADEVLLHGFLDTLNLLPFLFLTYLLMEFIEHRAGDKFLGFARSAGKLGPLCGSALGLIPQCGISAAAASLYTGRVITVGTLVAVFLSTSDEMIPILIGGDVAPTAVLLILGYKLLVAAAVGFAVDAVRRLTKCREEEINIDEICERDNCHCERGILFSAVHHTLTITAFVFAVTLAINTLIFFIGEDTLGDFINKIPYLAHLFCAIVGLIPNCAASVVLSSLYVDGLISAGAMCAGLFSGAGVGLLVLFRINRHVKENLAVLGIVVSVGFIFGIIFDFLPFGI